MNNPQVYGANQTGRRLLISGLDQDFVDPTMWGFHFLHADPPVGHWITGIEHYGGGAGACFVGPPIDSSENVPNQEMIIFGFGRANVPPEPLIGTMSE